MVNNKFLTGIYKDAIVFFLENMNKHMNNKGKKTFVNQNDLLQQINSATIVVESTPYYCILKFYHNGVYESSHDKVIEIQVVRENVPPTVLHMYLTNNILYEFEYFKADSSKIYNEELLVGNVLIYVY